MEGVTDWVFREVVKKAGEVAQEKTTIKGALPPEAAQEKTATKSALPPKAAQEKTANKNTLSPEVMFTEFTNVSSFASEEGRANALNRLRPTVGVKTVAQIWGKNPDHFAETARGLSALGFAGLDINMGCPDRHVVRAGGGSAMIINPELARECVERARAETELPISVKTRLGYSEVNEFRKWLPFLLKLNLSALTIHLRTKKEMSKVPAHRELISEIVAMRDEIAPKTKLIVNGDVKNRAEALSICTGSEIRNAQSSRVDLKAKKTSTTTPNSGVDGVMIGRGVFENVFCFTNYQPTQDDLRALFLYHLDCFDEDGHEIAQRGGRQKFEPLKHFYKVYFKGFDGAKELRERLMGAKTTDELRAILAN